MPSATPPYLVLDGYRETDREGRSFLKPDFEKVEKTEYYQYFIPFWRGHFYDSRQRSDNQCAFFEAQFYKCMEAFGAKLGYLYCDLEHRDLTECVTNDKKLKRYQAIKDIRFKQWLRGERKTMFEPIKEYVDSVKAEAGMLNKIQSKEKKH